MTDSEKKTILVVDDNDEVRRLVKKVLMMSEYIVFEAVDAASTDKAIDERLPDLILMDIRLPGKMSGLEITRQLKDDSRTQRVPVVALTASVLERDRQQALAAGCCGFIAKPIDITTLPKLVEKFMTRGAMAPR